MSGPSCAICKNAPKPTALLQFQFHPQDTKRKRERQVIIKPFIPTSFINIQIP